MLRRMKLFSHGAARMKHLVPYVKRLFFSGVSFEVKIRVFVRLAFSNFIFSNAFV